MAMSWFVIPDDSIHEELLRLSRLLIDKAQPVLINLRDVYHCPPSIDCSESFGTSLPYVKTPLRKRSSSPELGCFFPNHSREQEDFSPGFNARFAGHSRKQRSSPGFDGRFPDHPGEQYSLPGFDNVCPDHSSEHRSLPGFDNVYPGHSREQRCSEEIDITNIFSLLRNECGLLPPPTGWNALPNDDDLSLSADITRIKWYRNDIAHKNEEGAKLTEDEYNCFKEKIVSSLRRIVQDYSGTDVEAVEAWEKRVQECLTSPITQEDERNVEKLKAWYLKDVEEEQRQSSETDDWDVGVKGVSGKTVENEEKHYDQMVMMECDLSVLCGSIFGCVGVFFSRIEEKKCYDYIPRKPCSHYKVSLMRQATVFIDCRKSHKNEIHGLSAYHCARGMKDVDSDQYINASTHFLCALNSSPSENDVLLKASLQNNIGCALLLGNKNEKAKMALNQVIQTMNCTTQTVKDSHFIEKAKSILFVLRNNHACVELVNGNFVESLSTYKNLYKEEKGKLEKDDKLKRKIFPRVPVENGELRLSHNRSAKLLNLVIVAVNYSQACLLSGKLENIVEVLQEVIQICQGCQLQLVVSARLARIFTVLGMKKPVEKLVEQHDIDCLKLQKIIESDFLKPFSAIYTDDICRVLAHNGERSKARELLETAVRVCQEMYSKQHPTVISLEKTKDELFPNLVMEKACRSMEEDNISRLKIVTNAIVEWALLVLSNDSDRERLLSELNALSAFFSDEKSFADVFTSEKQPALSTESPTVAFVSTLCLCAFLLQRVKSGSKAESYLQKQLAMIESIYNDLEEIAMSESGMSLLSDNESCCISSLCSLLETALAQHAHTSVDGICTSLVSYLSRGHNEDLNEVKYWYKDYCGLLSYFVATNHVQISGNKIPLYVIVASGSGLKTPADVSHLSEEKAFLNKIYLSAAESKECSSNTPGANAKYFVFLSSQDLVDIGDLRRINDTIVQSVQSLDSSSINVNYQRSLFIEVGPEIDPDNVSGLCLQLKSLKCCIKNSGADCYDPGNEPSAQQFYLQKLQKPLTFKEEIDLDVFTALFQYTFCNLGIVDVQYKARKKMACRLKESPFSVLTLHTKENTMYLTLQDVGDKCFRDGNRESDATQLIDDTIAECLEKLGICSTNDPRDVWRGLSTEQTDDIPVFCAEEEDELEKAFKTNARLTAELEYLKSKQEKQTSRIKKLLDNLSEVELRVGLLQHFADVIFSDKDKMKAVENWITRKRTRQTDPQEGPSNEVCYEVEEILGSMANDELAELLAEIQRLDPMVTEDEASGSSREVSSNEDIDGAELHLLSDKQRIVLEETNIEKSLDGEKHKDFTEGKKSSNRPSLYLPSPPESAQAQADETESPVLREGYTQTDSLSSVQEYQDKIVQTDPVQQTNVETLENVGMADFRRDRAERQLRKSRLSQDVLAFKNRPREPSASFQGSIVAEESGSFSEGVPPYSITSGSLPETWNSKASITSQEPRQGTEGVSSKETARDSFTSESLPEPWNSKASIGTEGVLNEGTPLDSPSFGSSEQFPSQCSIVGQESSYGTEASPNSMTSSSLPDPWTSKSSVCSEAASHGTEDATSEGMPPDSIFRDSSTQQYPSKGFVVIEASSNSAEEASNKETPRKSTTCGSSLEQLPHNRPIVGKEESQETEGIPIERTPQDPVNSRVVSEHVTETSVASSTSGNKQSMDDPFSGYNSLKGTNRVVPVNEMLDLTVPEVKTSPGIARESGNAHLKKNEYDDAISYSERCLAIAQECGDKEEEMKVYMLLGKAHMEKEEYDDAISCGKKCLPIAQECGDKEKEMEVYMILGRAHMEKEEYDDAISCGKKCLPIAQECGDKEEEMNAYWILGDAHLKKGEYDDAILYSKRYLAIAQECGDKEAEMNAYWILGDAHLEKGEYDDAILYSKRYLAIAQECGDKEAEMYVNKKIVKAHLEKGEYDEAILYSKRCLAIAQESGDKEAEMYVNKKIVKAHLEKGEYDEAILYSKRYLAIAQESGDKETEMYVNKKIVKAHLEKGEYDEAILYSKRCLAIAQECGDKEDEMNAYITLGDAHLKKEQYEDAISHSEKCLLIAQETGDKVSQMEAHYRIADAHLKKEEYEDAISHSQKCLTIARECGNKVAEMKASLVLREAHLKKGEYDDAISHSQKCLTIARECGNKVAEMKASLVLREAHFKKGEYDDAISYSKRCLAIAQETGDKEAEMNACRTLGKIKERCKIFENTLLKNLEHENVTLYNERCRLPIAREIGEMIHDTNGKGSTIVLFGEAGAGKSSLAQKILQPFSMTKSHEENEQHFDFVDGRLACHEALKRPCAFVLPRTDNKERDSGCLGSSVEAKCKSRRTESDAGGVDKQRTRNHHRHKECYCVHEGGEGNKLSKGSSVSSEGNGRDNERTQFLEYAESDGGEHTSLNTKKLDVSSDETSTHDVTSRELVRDDVRTHDPLNKHDVHSTTDHSLETSTVAASCASCTVLGNFGSSNGKTNDEHDKSVAQCITGKDTPQNSENFPEGHHMFRGHLQSNVKRRKTNIEDTKLNGENVGTTVGNGQCMSLPPRVIQEVSNDEKRSGRIPPLPPHLQQGENNEACLRTIREIDVTGDADNVWTSQGARPKRIRPLHAADDDDDFIVSGVDTSFLARHSRDSSLTQSVYSGTQVPTHHSSFLSLPVFPEKAEVPSLARTWPLVDERRSSDHKDVLVDKSRPPYQGLPLGTQKENVRFQDKDNNPCKQQTDVPLPGSQLDIAAGTVPLSGSHSDVATGKLPLPGSQLDIAADTVPLSGSHSDVATGKLPLPGSPTDVATGKEPLPGSQPDVATGKVPLPGSQTEVVTGTGSSHFNTKNASNVIVDLSPTQNTNSSSDDEDSYQTADDSFSSLDSLEDQVKRSKMTWSQMSASTMFGSDDDDEEEEENRSNEVLQPEDQKEAVKNLERTEGRARKTNLEGATSSSPREDFARREQSDVMTTSQSSAEQATAQRVPADVIDAKERKIRLEREREREERRKREEEEIRRRLETSQRAREQRPPSTPQPARLPVQESASEWPCSHYKRRCAIKFPCCEDFYYCHRCHNNSDLCPKDDKKALHGTHLRCLVCLTEQEITENSQYCINCKTQLAEYFCGICKHFTGNEKKPYHCEPCGICRIHSDRSFHCKVCNVCLDERLRNNHICRPDSGHDECCICLEDAFGGCQILPCSHKVHRDCAIAMLQNGVRKCPVCRHPLNQPMQREQHS